MVLNIIVESIFQPAMPLNVIVGSIFQPAVILNISIRSADQPAVVLTVGSTNWNCPKTIYAYLIEIIWKLLLQAYTLERYIRPNF